MDIQKHASDFSAENLRKSYINNILNRNTHIHNFISMLLNIEKGGVIAIDGEWGSGKTYFVHQVKWLFDSVNENIDSDIETVLNSTSPKLDNIIGHKYKVFYYDAWKHDKSNNPFFTLLRTMILAFGGIDYFKEETSFIKSLLKGASHIVKGVTPIDAEWIFKGTKELCGINDTEQFSELEFIEQMDNQVDSFLDYICEGQYDKLVVFIDELDRCRPSFAVELLEIIKHYFNNDKVIFVLSTNLSEFQHCIKQYYGEGFNGWKYLDRFIDIRVTLPKITAEEYCKYLWSESYNDRIDDLAICCAQHFDLTLREIERYNNLVKISIQNALEKQHNTNSFRKDFQDLYAFWIPIILAVKFHSGKEYFDFVAGKRYSLIASLMLKETYRNSAIALLFNENEKNNQNYDLVYEKVEYYYEKIFLGASSKDFSHKLSESIKFDDLRIDEAVKQDLINIVNLFSTWSVYDV